MINSIVEQIKTSFSFDEELVSFARVHHNEENCSCVLILSNKRLFVFDNKVGNDEVNYFSIIKILEIEHKKDSIYIHFADRDMMTFSYLSMNDELKDFLQKASVIISPIIEEKKQEIEKKEKQKKGKRMKSFLLAFLTLAMISGAAVGGTLGWRYYTEYKAEEARREQQEAEEAKKAEVIDKINTINNQIAFTDSYKNRLGAYKEYIEELQTSLNNVDISDKTMDWETFKKEMNQKNIEFKDIKINDEDMTDFNVVISEKEGYIASKTNIINQNLDSVLLNIKENVDNKFTADATLMITLKATLEDSLDLINSLNDSIDAEKELLKAEVVKLEASLKE